MRLEEGFASAMLIALLALAGLLCLVTADAANVLITREHAQQAADAAALAAAAAEWPWAAKNGETPEDAASEAAQRNGATLDRCDCPPRGTARVDVTMPTRIRMLGVAPSKVHAHAEAKLDVNRIFAPQRG